MPLRLRFLYVALLALLFFAAFMSEGFAAPPANDNFASRTVLVTGVAATVSTAEATKEATETAPSWLAANRYQKSVWWKWTAPASGWYQATTSGSAADSVLTVSTGTALNTLTLIQANDQDMRANVGLTSELLHNYEPPIARILFQATAGTDYQMAVATSSVDAGLVRLKVDSAPAPSPRLTAFSITPTVDANGASPRGTATFSLTSQTPFVKGTFLLYGRVNGYQVRAAGFTATNRTSGDALNGTYTVPFNPQTRSPAGTMDWQLLLEADADAEISSYGVRGQTPPPAGAPGSFAVITTGTPDSTAPVIVSFDITPITQDVTTGVKSSTGSVRVTDAAAGVKIVMVSLIDSLGREFYRSGWSSRTSGTLNDGVYLVNFDFPYYWKLGSYTVRVWAEDFAGNVSTPLTSGTAGWPGPFTGPLQINRTSTFAMNSLVITPSTVDVTNGPQTVTIDANVTPVGSAAVFTLWAGMAAEPVFNTFAPEVFVSSGNANVVQTATGWRATMVIPKGYPPGLALLGVQISNASAATYFGPKFNLPFPVGNPLGVTVINDGTVDIRPPRAEYTATANEPMVRSGVVGDGVNAVVRVTDDASGLPDTAIASVGLRTSDYSVLGYHTALKNTDRIRGTDLDGKYAFFMFVESALHSPLSSGDYIMECSMTDRVGRKANINRTKVFKIASPPSAYTTWVNSNFPTINGNASVFNLWSPYVNPDNDGAVNLMEAYFDTDPNSRQPQPPQLLPGPLAGEISATWIEPAATHGITVTPYWSPDLVAWMASGEALRDWPARTLTVETLGPVTGGTQKRVRMSNAGLSKAWLRLQVVPGP